MANEKYKSWTKIFDVRCSLLIASEAGARKLR